VVTVPGERAEDFVRASTDDESASFDANFRRSKQPLVAIDACPRPPVYCVPRTARRRGCLRTVSTPELPFCAAATMVMTVVLARCSAPGRVCSIAGSRTVDSAHRFGCRLRICVLWGHAWRCPCLLELHAPLGISGRVETSVLSSISTIESGGGQVLGCSPPNHCECTESRPREQAWLAILRSALPQPLPGKIEVLDCLLGTEAQLESAQCQCLRGSVESRRSFRRT
jgi:hypothetical protein